MGPHGTSISNRTSVVDTELHWNTDGRCHYLNIRHGHAQFTKAADLYRNVGGNLQIPSGGKSPLAANIVEQFFPNE